jgi:antitoxin (DNA-binding transcriptional repressor) of toxin-antitoxin stability system
MKTISKRELSQQTARVLETVTIGRPVIITERGRARWRIESIDAAADPIASLRAEGRITPPKTTPAPWPVLESRYTPAQVDALLLESRGDH